jgi:hypothetical protein
MRLGVSWKFPEKQQFVDERVWCGVDAFLLQEASKCELGSCWNKRSCQSCDNIQYTVPRTVAATVTLRTVSRFRLTLL